MAVSVKIREDTKRRIERMGATVASKTGIHLNFQEMVDALVQRAESDPSFVIGAGSQSRLPLPASAQRRVKARAWDWGLPTSEEAIDRALYAPEAIHGESRPPTRRRGSVDGGHH